MSHMMSQLAEQARPPLPPFTLETARQKVRMAEDGWNSRDPARIALAYTPDSRWRNRTEFLQGRVAIETFLTRKWQRELDYRLIKESERQFFWPAGRRPDDHLSLSDLDL